MLAPKVEIEDDGYVPSGLLNNSNKALERNSIKANEICEFYNINKTTAAAIESSPKAANELVDLSTKSEQNVFPATKTVSTPPSSNNLESATITGVPPSPTHFSSPRVLTLQPGSHHPQLPTDAPRPPPVPTRPYIPRTIQVSPMQTGIYRPVHMPYSVPSIYQYGGRQMFHPRQTPYQPSGMIPMKIPQPAIMPPQALLNPNAGVYTPAYLAPVSPSINQMQPMFHPTMMLVAHAPTMMHHMNPYQAMQMSSPQKPLEQIMAPQEQKPKISQEVRKKLREEAAAKLKAERDARKALMKAAKIAEKEKNAALKKKRIAQKAETGPRKFGNFSKDMFVIRLKDVDSFNRNNEIWRIDNHVLIQKFCGVPSLRAPARQFQSTNRMSGYDTRATWRLFIINPDNVEINRNGSEVTIYDFPAIQILREAKQLAEMKDGAFKEIEKSEYEEKLKKLKQKQDFRLQAKLKKRMERRQKKLNKNTKASQPKATRNAVARSFTWDDDDMDDLQGEPSYFKTNINDDGICRDIVNGMLDALEDEEYGGAESLMSSDDDSDFSDEEEDEDEEEEEEEQNYDYEDAGSLISLARSENENDVLYEEHELPAVALELVVD
ncbi:unnamed protein product [Caenorhabditis brenneri]